MTDITGKLKSIIYRSLDNDFTIASFEPEKTGLEFIATGDLFKPTAGLTYSLSGEWQEHYKYGKQFKIKNYCVQEPCDTDSIAAYLEKHIKGIGPVLADALIEKYGKYTIRILKKAPERVSDENKGLSYKVALKISEQLQEGDKRQDILIQLEGIFTKVKGLPSNLAQSVVNIYGLTAHEVIKATPYLLIEMNRVGFILADKVAMACGIKPDDSERIKHGILYVIRQTMQETGDIWLRPSAILHELSKLTIKIGIAKTIVELINNKILMSFGKFVTLTQYAEDEDCIADCVGRFL